MRHWSDSKRDTFPIQTTDQRLARQPRDVGTLVPLKKSNARIPPASMDQQKTSNRSCPKLMRAHNWRSHPGFD